MRSHFIIGFLLITLVILLITKLELATKNFSSQLDSFTIVYKADHILAPETPHLVLRSKAKQTRNKEDVIHVVMTTFKNDPNDHGIRAQIERNTEHSWANLHPRVKLMTGCARKAVDGDGDVDCERNHAGTPTLRGFYRLAFERYPNAATFTFFNGDIISDMSFVDTADAVVKAVRQGKLRERFFVVGRRTNVDWSKVSVQDVADPRFNFRQTIVDGGKVRVGCMSFPRSDVCAIS